MAPHVVGYLSEVLLVARGAICDSHSDRTSVCDRHTVVERQSVTGTVVERRSMTDTVVKLCDPFNACHSCAH